MVHVGTNMEVRPDRWQLLLEWRQSGSLASALGEQQSGAPYYWHWPLATPVSLTGEQVVDFKSDYLSARDYLATPSPLQITVRKIPHRQCYAIYHERKPDVLTDSNTATTGILKKVLRTAMAA